MLLYTFTEAFFYRYNLLPQFKNKSNLDRINIAPKFNISAY